jgi:RimJ/RimL family protein N-acetyltransferase
MTWTARRAELADAGELARINVASWQHACRGLVSDVLLGRMLPESRINGWKRWVGLPDPDGVFVAEDSEGRIGAYCGVCEARDPEDVHEDVRTGELLALYADPDRQGTGAGSTAHEAGVEHLAAQGFRYAVLWVFQDNAASRAFYEYHGWRHDGTVKLHDVDGQRLPTVRYGRFLRVPGCRHHPPAGRPRYPASG